jgi:restriction system protein
MRMPPTNATAKPASARRPLFDNGVAALAFGVVCLLAPVLLEGSGRFSSLAELLRIPGVLGVGLGVVLLALHVTARRHPKQQELLPAASDEAAVVETGPAADWSASVLERLGTTRLAIVCEKLFAQAGFSTHRAPLDDGGNIDLWLYSKHAQGTAAIVRCTPAPGDTIGIDEMHLFYATLAAQSVSRGTYATNGTFTDEARRFAREHGINALDRDRLLALIGSRTSEQQQELLAAAAEGL